MFLVLGVLFQVWAWICSKNVGQIWCVDQILFNLMCPGRSNPLALKVVCHVLIVLEKEHASF